MGWQTRRDSASSEPRCPQLLPEQAALAGVWVWLPGVPVPT